jgi:hypothetical protein
MKRWSVSMTRTVREDAIVSVEAENEVEAEERARHEVAIDAVRFVTAAGAVDLAVDWVVQEDAQARPDPAGRRSAMGNYRHVAGSSDDFAQRKQEDIELEDRGWSAPEARSADR